MTPSFKNLFSKRALLLFMLTAKTFTALSQNQGPTGRVMSRQLDSTQTPLALANVGLMNVKDSSLIEGTLTDENGFFAFKNKQNSNNFLLKIQYLSHNPVFQKIVFDANHPSLGTFSLKQHATTLKEVVIMHEADLMPKQKGDTLEYNTANVKMGKYDNITDLMRTLPGMQVDAKGKVSTNNEQIQKYYVNGMEVPSTEFMALVNAKHVKTIQVINDKNDVAKNTGVDDGKRSKSLNIIMKNDVVTSKGDIKLGSKKTYSANGNYTAFKKSYNFMNNFSASNMGMAMGGQGMPGMGDDPMNAPASAGVPVNINNSIFYTRLLGPKKDHVSGAYTFSYMSNKPVTSQTTLQILPESVYKQNQESRSNTRQINHTGQAGFGLSHGLASWNFIFVGMNGQSDNDLTSTTVSAFNDTLVNQSNRTVHTSSSNKNMSLMIAGMFKSKQRKSRIMAFSAEINNSQNKTNNQFYAANQFYNSNGTLSSADTTDQQRENSDKNAMVNLRVNLTDSLGKRLKYSISYGHSSDGQRTLQNTFDNANGHYDKRVDSLSNDLVTSITKHQGIFVLSTNIKKARINFFGIFENTKIAQTDKSKLTKQEQSYNQFTPRLIVDIPLNRMSSLTINYLGLSRQPSLRELQPIRDNSNPLHINEGNRDLRLSYTHSPSIEYRNFKLLQLQANGKFDFSTTDISNSVHTDSAGRQKTKPVNVSGGKSASLNISIGQQIKSIATDIRLANNINYNKHYNMIGDQESANSTYALATTIFLMKDVRDKFRASLSAGIEHNHTKNSLSEETLSYWAQNIGAQISVFILQPVFPLELYSNLQYTTRQKTSDFDKNVSLAMWNAGVNKRALKDRATFNFQVNNILDQDNNVTRNTQLNTITETTANTLGRICTFGFSYQLDKKPPNQKAKPI